MLSVIIPVYNRESFVKRTAISVFEQTLGDFEIIFVDDGSSDDSIKVIKRILDDYPDRKSQTKIVCLPKNVGVSKARKIGLNHVTMEYVSFLDSDDWLENNSFEIMLDYAIGSQCDLLLCDYTVDKIHYDYYVKQRDVDNNIDFIRCLLKDEIHGSLCNKLFKKSILDNVIFPENIQVQEDLVVSLQYGLLSNKITYLNKAFLHYTYNINSSSKPLDFDRIKRNIFDMFFVLKFIKYYLVNSDCYYLYKKYYFYRCLLTYISCFKKIIFFYLGIFAY